MSNLFDGLFQKETKVPMEEPKVKYTPLVLTEDEALKRVKDSVPEDYTVCGATIKADKIVSTDSTGFPMNPPTSTMSEPERQKLIQVVQNFDEEELEIVVDTIPLEMCFARIKKEINRAKEFESIIKTVVGQMH